ncbi:hypothetical protein F0562_026845 [Nyssa sinensis]|uniref:DNA polymerase delta subunit 4 n=1 Tax=Nyssa sinensis TaxID=561372 RepID=A0A5J5BAH4_9ASTE|nr:hypothetical protein F0562_026845 [Nyssa sinensis]
MASTRGDMKGFFRQRKKSGGIAKPSAKPKGKVSSSSSKKSSPNHSVTFGSDIAQPPAFVSHGSVNLNDYYDENEEVLRQFDMNMVYGPCLGMSRLARWERANSMGLDPPEDVERLLKGAKASSECLWDGRV